MYKPLVPCPSCRRHVRTTESDCPFCSAALPEELASRALPSARQRLSRAAAFVFTATIASSVVGAAACSGDVEDGTSTSDDSDSGDSGDSDGIFDDDGPSDDGDGVAEYGAPAPPPDGGPDDDGGTQSKYGAPVPPDDAGVADDGGGSADYGAPPPRDAG